MPYFWKKSHLSNLDKNIIVFNLLRTIRNRAFHWENLLKTRKIKGALFPRITHRENGTVIGVMPDKILTFLDDLLGYINNEEINKNAKNILKI